MKNRYEFNQVGVSGGDQIRNTKKNEKRIGGKALSLEAFANAKSRVSGYNPSFIKKQREFYRNAKYINKFKKSAKQENRFNEFVLDANLDENVQLKSEKMKKKRKKSSRLKDIGEEVEKKRAESEKSRMVREAMLHAKKEERTKAEAKRKVLRENMSKRTRSGQPVMKFRIQRLLEGLRDKP